MRITINLTLIVISFFFLSFKIYLTIDIHNDIYYCVITLYKHMKIQYNNIEVYIRIIQKLRLIVYAKKKLFEIMFFTTDSLKL